MMEKIIVSMFYSCFLCAHHVPFLLIMFPLCSSCSLFAYPASFVLHHLPAASISQDFLPEIFLPRRQIFCNNCTLVVSRQSPGTAENLYTFIYACTKQLTYVICAFQNEVKTVKELVTALQFSEDTDAVSSETKVS